MGVQIGVFQHTEPPQEDRPAAVQQLEDARIVGGQRGIMDGNQPHRAVRKVGRGLEAAQNRAGSLRPPLVVPFEMRRAVGADCAALRLGDVVQKGSPAQHPHAAGVLPAQVKCGHSGGRMLPHIVAVPPPRLGAADAGQDLRHYAAQNLAVLRKRFPGAGGQQQAVQLGVEPLGADSAQGVAGRQRGGSGSGLQRKAELCGEPQGPQDAQRVLGKAVGRCADTPHDTGGQITAAAVEVDDPLAGGVGHGVDGEVPPRKVGGKVVHKLYAVGVAVVAVAAVQPVGRDLIRLAVQDDRYCAVLFAGQDKPLVMEDRPQLVGPGGGADVPVAGQTAQQAVAHAAAHHIGTVPGGAQRLQQSVSITRQAYRIAAHAVLPPLSAFLRFMPRRASTPVSGPRCRPGCPPRPSGS